MLIDVMRLVDSLYEKQPIFGCDFPSVTNAHTDIDTAENLHSYLSTYWQRQWKSMLKENWN